MANIFKSAGGIMNNVLFDEMELLVKNYWGDLTEEKIFPIPLWKLKQLFSAYQSSDVAFRVTDIASKLLVDAQWVVFDENLENLLQQPTVQPNDNYFVLSEATFVALRGGASNVPQNLTLITGRIGKTSTTVVVDEETTITKDKYYVFFNVSKNDFKKPGGGGGDGTSSGFRIPSP
jgi:hypothetical protein